MTEPDQTSARRQSLAPLVRTLIAAALLFGRLAASGEESLSATGEPPVNTFSIVAFDPATGDLGIAVASKVLGVGAIVPFAKANVGAIATQSAANTGYGPEGLKLLESGKSAAETLQELTDADSRRATRQAGIVDARGNAATFTGTNCNAWAGGIAGDHFAVQGNILTGEEVVKAMAEAYEKARKLEATELADWLVAALRAGETAGGDKRGKQSAALLVVREKANYDQKSDRYIDLRVEDHAEPVKELSRLLEIHKQFYVGSHKNKPKREAK